jgi:uncharacterized protein YjbI with pentapeptide repeats
MRTPTPERITESLEGADLRGADLTDIEVTGANFDGAQMDPPVLKKRVKQLAFQRARRRAEPPPSRARLTGAPPRTRDSVSPTLASAKRDAAWGRSPARSGANFSRFR